MVDNRALYRSEAGYQAVMAAYEAGLAAGPVPYTTRWVETGLGKSFQSQRRASGRMAEPCFELCASVPVTKVYS